MLGGRNKEKVIEQAKQYNLDYRVFDLSNLDEAQKTVSEFVAVVHCAGPFIRTFRNMAKVCIATQTHYLDITGEIAVIEGLAMMDARAKAANVMLLPGAGFDVVPTDCMAQHLKSRLPDATELTLAICAMNTSASGMAVSRGTAKTMLYGLSADTFIRDGGELKPAPANIKGRTFTFGNGAQRVCMPFSWGDLASAWWSTHIPHITVYMAASKKSVLLFKLIKPFKSIFKIPLVFSFLQNRINKGPEGPTAEMRKTTSSHIYGEVKNAKGMSVSSRMIIPEGYDFTAISVVHIIKKVLAGDAPIGFQTPSTAYGKDLVMEMDGVSREDL